MELTALDENGELLQSGFWGSFKQTHGWRAFPFEITVSGLAAAAEPRRFFLLVLTRRLLRFRTLAYVPFGPVLDPGAARGDFLASLADALRPHLPRDTFLLRFDLPWEKGGESPGSGGRVKVR